MFCLDRTIDINFVRLIYCDLYAVEGVGEERKVTVGRSQKTGSEGDTDTAPLHASKSETSFPQLERNEMQVGKRYINT